jgi:hypothetical protein
MAIRCVVGTTVAVKQEGHSDRLGGWVITTVNQMVGVSIFSSKQRPILYLAYDAATCWCYVTWGKARHDSREEGLPPPDGYYATRLQERRMSHSYHIISWCFLFVINLFRMKYPAAHLTWKCNLFPLHFFCSFLTFFVVVSFLILLSLFFRSTLPYFSCLGIDTLFSFDIFPLFVSVFIFVHVFVLLVFSVGLKFI